MTRLALLIVRPWMLPVLGAAPAMTLLLIWFFSWGQP